MAKTKTELEIEFIEYLQSGYYEGIHFIPECYLKQACAMTRVMNGAAPQIIAREYGMTRNWVERLKTSVKDVVGLQRKR